ncbi:MAG TPA: hypothetical protein VIL37_12340 [Natronosporangium sp.]
MLFERRLRDGIADGSITLMFRRWRRPQAVAGHRYRTGRSMIEVESVSVVEPANIGEADARQAGYPDPAALIADLRGEPGLPVYRIAFRRVDEPDPREALAADAALTPEDVAEIDRRLDRLDRASRTGPWTAAALALIAEHPGTRAADLAARLGRELLPFKADVRKLKNLGLTHSLEVGYRLSPRGAAYLAGTARRAQSASPNVS